MKILNTRPCTCPNCGEGMPHFFSVVLNLVSCVKCGKTHQPTLDERAKWPAVIPLTHGGPERV